MTPSALSDPLPPVSPALPEGVELRPLATHADDRGALTEVFRRTWRPDFAALQWNLVHSRAGTLRGVHVHRHHDDYLTVISGETLVGLRDLRRHSPTRGQGTLVTLTAASPAALFIPPGVAHGFLHVSASIHLYAVSRFWDPTDELGCRWNDPQLNLPWPIEDPLLSERDRVAQTLGALLAECGAHL